MPTSFPVFLSTTVSIVSQTALRLVPGTCTLVLVTYSPEANFNAVSLSKLLPALALLLLSLGVGGGVVVGDVDGVGVVPTSVSVTELVLGVDRERPAPPRPG